MARSDGVRSLDELELVDWAVLGHPCSGPSLPQIPELVRAILTGGDDAENRLWCVALHQGQIGEVTGHVLPFIFGLLLDHPPLRPSLCDWLSQTSAVFEHDGADFEGTRIAWRRAAPSLLPLLEDDVPEVRAITAGALSMVDDLEDVVWTTIRKRIDREPDPLVANDLRYALVRAARSEQAVEMSGRLSWQWLADTDPLIRAAGAHAVLWRDPTQVQARHHLTSLLPAGLAGSPFFGVGSLLMIVEDLSRAELDIEEVLPAVLASLGRHGFFGDAMTIPYILTNLFGPPGHEPPASLTAGQRLALKKISSLPLQEHRGAATVISPICHHLRSHGLPTDPDALRVLAES